MFENLFKRKYLLGVVSYLAGTDECSQLYKGC